MISKRGYTIPNAYYAGLFLALVLIGTSPLNNESVTGYAAKSSEKTCSQLDKQWIQLQQQQITLYKAYDLNNPSGTAAQYVKRLSVAGDCFAPSMANIRVHLDDNAQQAATRQERKDAQQAISDYKKQEIACNTILQNCKKMENLADQNNVKLNQLWQEQQNVEKRQQQGGCFTVRAVQPLRITNTLFCPR
ncbi:MAG: hypothetical protein Q7R56_03520 [Nanoarchaeota archaeon]|nr:hypothetical protein [Nanoarchaeota archaeon]